MVDQIVIVDHIVGTVFVGYIWLHRQTMTPTMTNIRLTMQSPRPTAEPHRGTVQGTGLQVDRGTVDKRLK